jgi:lipoprotein-anchoring transpeptidase ErfK/SrfK
MLRGVTVGGMPIGGMSFEQARARLLDQYQGALNAPITVTAGSKVFDTTPKELGAKTNVLEGLRQLTELHQGMPLMRRLWYRLLGKPINRVIPVTVTIDENRMKAFIDRAASAAKSLPHDASVSLAGDGISITEDQPGFTLDKEKSLAVLQRGVLAGAVSVSLVGETVAAKLRKPAVTDVLVVKIGENKLYHYKGTDLIKVYNVAPGMAAYPTPLGQFRITGKSYLPTWVNPAKYPGGWGFNLPDKIPPGPGNPLGTRALSLSASGILIHGTYSAYSIGYNASHGCIRMRIPDSEELFGQVTVGTPVLIVSAGPLRPLPSRLTRPTPTIESLIESHGAQAVPPSPSPTPTPTSTVTATPTPTPTSTQTTPGPLG